MILTSTPQSSQATMEVVSSAIASINSAVRGSPPASRLLGNAMHLRWILISMNVYCKNSEYECGLTFRTNSEPHLLSTSVRGNQQYKSQPRKWPSGIDCQSTVIVQAPSLQDGEVQVSTTWQHEIAVSWTASMQDCCPSLPLGKINDSTRRQRVNIPFGMARNASSSTPLPCARWMLLWKLPIDMYTGQ